MLSEGESSPSSVEIRYQLRPDENRLVLDPESVKGLKEVLAGLPEDAAVLKVIITAFLDLSKIPVVFRNSGKPALEAGSSSDGTIVLPPSDPRVLAHNRSVLQGEDNHIIGMTVMFGGESAAIRHLYQVGTVSMDAEGRIIGTALSRPDFQSPRGTQYRRGLSAGSEEVPVILNGNTLMWHGSIAHLNAKQQAEFLALFDQSAESRAKMEAEDPYGVDAVLGHGLGKMAMDISGLVYNGNFLRGSAGQSGRVQLKLNITRDGNGLLRAAPEGGDVSVPYRPWGHARPAEGTPILGHLELQFDKGGKGEGLAYGLALFPRLDTFDYRLEPGLEAEAQILELLGYLQKSFTSSGE